MQAGVLVLAAGRGERLGESRPKAHVEIGGRSVLAHSALALARARCISHVLPVVGPGAEEVLTALRLEWAGPAQLLDAVRGGATRQQSVAHGLDALVARAPELDWVLVHDAARCLVKPEDAERVLRAALASGAALPVIAVTDTLKEVSDGRVLKTPDRANFKRALTPQAFRIDLLREALEQAERDGFEGTDCSSLVERLGAVVVTCEGRAENVKLTTPQDLERMRDQLAPGIPSQRRVLA